MRKTLQPRVGVKTVAALTGLSDGTVYVWIKEGLIYARDFRYQLRPPHGFRVPVDQIAKIGRIKRAQREHYARRRTGERPGAFNPKAIR